MVPAEAEPHVRPPPQRRVAFGVPFEFDGVDLPVLGSGAGGPAVAGPPTLVHVVGAAQLAELWAAARPERTRELRDRDGHVALSVDADPERGYLLRTTAEGRFLVSADGLDVRCAPHAPWAHLLVGQLLPLVATLRGLEVLHASAVVLDGRALLFSAPPGGGKTSLALRLVLAGATLLTDDAASIDERLRVHPGAGALRLRADEWRRLAPGERERLGRSGDGRSSYAVGLAEGPAPVGALFAVRRLASGPPGPLLRRLDPVDPLTLLGATFNLSVRTPERLRRQLDLCARLAAAVPVLALEIPPGVDAATVAEHVREWAAA